MELLKALADSISRGQFCLLGGHAHREHNEHTDILSHALPDDVWSQVVAEAKISKTHRLEFHFAVLDVQTGECYLGTISIRDPHSARNSNRGARVASS